jgi:hypothetical protein
MKNLAKFLLFVLLLSAGISLLYDHRLKHGGLKAPSGRTPEKYTFASESAVNPKQVASLESLNQERRALVKSVVPSVVAVKTSNSSFRTSDDFAIHATKRWCRMHLGRASSLQMRATSSPTITW